MHYKHRNATRWQRLQGVYSSRGYEAALDVYGGFPKTLTVRLWRLVAWGRQHWGWFVGSLCVPILLWWLG